MGFLGKILSKLGFGDAVAAPVPSAAAPPESTPAATASVASPAPAAVQVVNPIAVVDVMAQLEQRAASNPQKLNWRTSIVDLLALLDIDNSLADRKELAQELGVNAGEHGSAEQNIALHKAVMAKLAANGGKVPASMRD